VLDGEANELVPAVELELAQDVADVVLDGLLRDVELGADLLVGVPPSHELEDFAFAGDSGWVSPVAPFSRRNSPSTSDASAGEKTGSPPAARCSALTKSGPVVDFTR